MSDATASAGAALEVRLKPDPTGAAQKVRLKADPTDDPRRISTAASFRRESSVGSGFSRTVRYSGSNPIVATVIKIVVLVWRPSVGSSRNPAATLPATAPAVLAK